MLIVAVFVGGATVWLARDFIESRAFQTSNSDLMMDTTRIVVAARQLNFGDTLRPEFLKEATWPSDIVPEGSFESMEALLDGEERRVTLRPIEPNEPILQSRVSGFGGRATLSQVISPNMRAVTLRVNDVVGVAGFVLPGDRVDILLTRQTSSGRNNQITDILIQNVRVMAVDQLANELADSPVVARAATVEVTPQQAQKLSLAASVGTLSFALRNVFNAEDENAQFRTVGVGDLSSTAAAKPGDKPSSAPSWSTKVRVLRGMTGGSQTVVREPQRSSKSVTTPPKPISAPLYPIRKPEPERADVSSLSVTEAIKKTIITTSSYTKRASGPPTRILNPDR